MKIAIVADIHSNYEAFVATLDEIKKEKVDKIYCCGDIVGYGPEPNECIELIRQHNIFSVLGNHDVAVLDKVDISWFREEAQEAIFINKNLISTENLSYLGSLHENEKVDDLLIVHGSPMDNIFEYLFTISSLRRNAKFMKEQICFCGHTHQPMVYAINLNSFEEKIDIPKNGSKFCIDNNYKYIINVGSVGQPRDGDNRASFVIYNLDDKTITFSRVEYNIKIVQDKMKKLNLPEFLIRRLEFGI